MKSARVAFAVFLSLFSISASAQDWGMKRFIDQPLELRAAAAKSSPVLRTLPRGTALKFDFEKDGTFAVFKPEEVERDVSRALGYVRIPGKPNAAALAAA